MAASIRPKRRPPGNGPGPARIAQRAAPARTLSHPPVLREVVLDRYRAFVFPNRVREQRQRAGHQKLMALSALLPEIPYIRLSKIERGEVFARPDELVRIARAIGIATDDLLVDVDAAGFDIGAWAEPFEDARAWDETEERYAVLVGAALRVRRNRDRALTIAALDRDYGLPAVILSRLENAHKTLDRWNITTLNALHRLFNTPNAAMLRQMITEQFLRGELDGYVETIANPDIRLTRTRERVGELRAALSVPAHGEQTASTKLERPIAKPAVAIVPEVSLPAVAETPAAILVNAPSRTLPVRGAPLPGGLIADTPTDSSIEAPQDAGPKAFGLRVCRATLGPGLPASATVIVDPDHPVVAGGIAAIRIGDTYRIVSVTFDRTGVTMGYSVNPDVEIIIDDLDPADVAGITGAIFTQA